MRVLTGITLLLAVMTLAAQEPERIVIRPGGSVPKVENPDPQEKPRPGYIVIRPQRGGTSPAASSPQLDSDPLAAPAAIKPKQTFASTIPVPVAKPMPVKQETPAKDEKPADTTNGKLIRETWDTAFIKGMRVGYYRVTLREHEKNGKKYIHATREQRLTMGRFGQRVEIWSEDSSTETPEGGVLAVRMRQGLSKDQMLAIGGLVEGNVLKVQGEGAAAGARNEIPWSDDVVGIAKESTLYADHKPKPGDTFDYRFYLGQTNRLMKVTVTAKALETVALIEGQPPRKFIRLEVATEQLKDPNGRVVFKMSPATVWCDAETYEPMRTDQDMPGLGGRLTILRTSKEVAMLPPAKVPDLFDVQSIRLANQVPDIHSLSSIIYRIKLSNEDTPTESFSKDTRQSIAVVADDKTALDLTITAVRTPTGGDPKPGDEYTAKSFFIDGTDARVRAHAQSAMAGLPANATEWQKAQAVERWVHRNMKAVEFSQAMATSSEVARTLSGDCTEYAMLSAAMCRAVGLPSRTALGLVYANSNGGAVLAYHMWFEVYADGSWVSLDSTLGLGSIGPGHLKITEASWNKELSFAPLLPVLRVLNGEPKVELRSIKK